MPRHFFGKIPSRVSIAARPVRLMDESSAAVKAEQVQKKSQGHSKRRSRMKYVCLGFIDETKFAEISQEDAQQNDGRVLCLRR